MADCFIFERALPYIELTLNKISGWRLHVQYGKNDILELCDVLDKEEHDDGLEKIKSRSKNYKKKRK